MIKLAITLYPHKTRVITFYSHDDKNVPVCLNENVEEKIEFLKNHPALKNVDAIKNNKIYVVGLADLSPGVRNPMVIEKMYGYFYGDNK
jgi:ABC-type Fe3+-hydroxamate transport system substrate-binding protein